MNSVILNLDSIALINKIANWLPIFKFQEETKIAFDILWGKFHSKR